MASKATFFLFLCALLFQIISSKCVGPANSLAWESIMSQRAAAEAGTPCASSWNAAWTTSPVPGAPVATAEWATGYSPASLAASNGGGLAVTSGSAIAPTGVAMASENAYGGSLGVSGTLPYLGAVALEGALPTAGSGAIAYNCGNGNVAITSEDVSAAGYNSLSGAYGYGPAAAAAAAADLGPLGYEAGISRSAYGPYGYSGYRCGAI